jgi:hypothetical protein
MKNLSKFLMVFTLIFWGLNTVKAQSSLKDDKAEKAKEVRGFVKGKDFVFEATQADLRKGEKPLNYHAYDVAVSKDTLVANLPGSGKGPLKIASTDYAYNAVKGKNGDWDIFIKPKAGLTSDVKQIRMEVTPQGHASMRVITATRGPLELNGYIKQEDY